MSRIKYHNSDFFERIEQLRKHLDIPMYLFAKKTGVSQSFMSELKAGRSGPSFKLMVGLFENISNLNIYWLLFGEGEMFLSAGSGDSGNNGGLLELQTLFKEVANRPQIEQEAIANVLRGILQLIKK